ncbi:MAG: hypothetical protein FWC10_02130 [Lentimicrobiaceae bacterium]|nr:hypothetical protein [Lentimicrobiaceae bacterium]
MLNSRTPPHRDMAKRPRKANYPSPHALAHHAHKNITAFSRHVFVSPPTNPHCDGIAFPVRFPSWRCRIAAHEATAPIQQRQPHAENSGKSHANILYRKIYKMPTPYLPLLSAFPTAHALVNNPVSYSNIRNLYNYTPLLTVVPAKPAAARYIFEIKRPAGVGNAMFATLTLHYQP